MEEAKLKNPNRWFKCGRCSRYFKLKELVQHRSKAEPNPRRFHNGQPGSNGVEESDRPPPPPSSANSSAVKVEASQGEVPFSQQATQRIKTKVEMEKLDPALVDFQDLLMAECEALQDTDVNVNQNLNLPGAAEVIEEPSKVAPVIVYEDNVTNVGETALETFTEEKQDRRILPENESSESQESCDNQIGKALASTDNENHPETLERAELVKLLATPTSDCPDNLLDIHQLPTQIVPTDQAPQHEDGQGESFLDTILSQPDVMPPTTLLVTSESSQCSTDSRILRRSERIKNQKLNWYHSSCGVMKIKKLPYKCNFCTIRFKTVERRFAHEQKRHPVFSELDPDFQMCRCPACPLRLFKTKCGFQQHFRKCHCILELFIPDEEQTD